MKVLLNVSGATKGGALHLATVVLREALAHRDGTQWAVAISSAAMRELKPLGVDRQFFCRIFDRSPARSPASRRALARMEAEVQPDCVFTPYGPAYVAFTSPHLVGVAVPWITNPTMTAYRKLSFPHGWLKTFLTARYQARWFRRADAWWIETDSAKQGLVKRLRLPSDRVAVVPNTCGRQYREQASRRPFPESDREVRLLYFTAPYRHKDLDMVPRVAKALAECNPALSFRMVTTLPRTHGIYRRMMRWADALRVIPLIDNRGPIPIADGPRLYAECDICFMPTVLEVFSATYPEAMAMGLPIVTSDLEFARDICGRAALYFRAGDPHSAAETICRLLRDATLWDQLIDDGQLILKQLPTPQQKYQIYLDLLSRLVNQRPLSASPSEPKGDDKPPVAASAETSLRR